MSKKDKQDEEDFKLILEAYKFRGYDKGSRGIKMRLLHKGINMNRKKIQRLMRKYGLFCSIRKANPYRRMAKALKTSNYADNLLERQFEAFGPGYVLLTDITYFFYGKDRIKCFLSVVKDAFTKQILSYKLSQSMEEDFVLDTINSLLKKHKNTLHTDALIHSDQGSHYTCLQFIDLLKNNGIRQSMSRRGNCWDNAPQESFFGHMKDEIGEKVKESQDYETLNILIDDYMDYYNTDRYQIKLAMLSPNQYFEYYTSGIYPLKDIVREPESIKHKFATIKESRNDQVSTSPVQANLQE